MPILRLLLVLVFACVATASAEWRTALPGWNYQFPPDHGAHPDFKTEWWYFTGNLQSADGQDFGYQLTFFRQGVIEPGRAIPGSNFLQRDMKFAHFAVSDIGAKKFHHFQKISRGAFGEAGFEDGQRLAWIDNWSCERIGPHDFRLHAEDGEVTIDLTLRSKREPVIHGRDGVSQKSEGAGRASHYYSLTRLETEGTIRLGKTTHAVSGLTWFDHEWATNQLAKHQTGWDWFSLQFDNGAELMIFQIRTKDGGRDAFSSGTWMAADGSNTKIDLADFSLEPVDWWKSPETQARYPVAWKISFPAKQLTLTVRARFPAQELAAEPFSYWEGAVGAEGQLGGAPIRGKGYLEMTGYAGGIVGMQAK
ncbi:MAG: lipocalin-like domain-containing protein [Terrimicrobiaceae bacterium]